MEDDHKKIGGHDDFSEVTLRPLDLTDIDDFMVWVTDDKVSKNCTWETYKSKEQGLEYIQNFVLPHPWYRAICVKNRPVGNILLTTNSAPGDQCRAELGYVLASEYWGKGIATKAVKKAIVAIFNEWPQLERLEALVDVDNLGSQKVLEKAGFIREGVLRKYYILKGRCRDFVMFSILSSDPKP